MLGKETPDEGLGGGDEVICTLYLPCTLKNFSRPSFCSKRQLQKASS